MFISYTRNEEKKSLSPRKKEKVEVFYNRGVVDHCPAWTSAPERVGNGKGVGQLRTPIRP